MLGVDNRGEEEGGGEGEDWEGYIGEWAGLGFGTGGKNGVLDVLDIDGMGEEIATRVGEEVEVEDKGQVCGWIWHRRTRRG